MRTLDPMEVFLVCIKLYCTCRGTFFGLPHRNKWKITSIDVRKLALLLAHPPFPWCGKLGKRCMIGYMILTLIPEVVNRGSLELLSHQLAFPP